jgi:UDP-GlcNAc:undecaprenyl-phosphate GlcNAc-1-phosphate transferase
VPTPLLGGAGLFAAFLGSLLLLSAAPWLNGQPVLVYRGLLAGAALVFLLGLYDDLRPITPPAKLIGQILAATLVIASGYTSHFFTPRIPVSAVAQILNILLTFAWLVGITNAFNLLDNMDGLSAGLALVTALILSFFFWKAGNTGLLLISLALAGSSAGFLVFNYPPATVFMGDSGALFLGFTLAVLAIARQPQASNVFAVVGVPTLLFLLPLLDMGLVTFTRLMRGQSPVQGGRDHTSHRLVAFGLSERQALLTLYAVALISGALAAALESLAYWLSLALGPLLVISLALLTAYLGGLRVLSDPAPAPIGRRQAILRIVVELAYRRRVLEVILDFFLVGLAYYLAFLIGLLVRAGLVLETVHLEILQHTLPLVLGGTCLAFFASGLYRGGWRLLGLNDLLRYARAALGGAALSAATVWIFDSIASIPRPVFLLYPIFLFLGLAGARASFQLLDEISRRMRERF